MDVETDAGDGKGEGEEQSNEGGESHGGGWRLVCRSFVRVSYIYVGG